MSRDLAGDIRGLTTYEVAYLCGSVERVVLVALVRLHSAGRIKMTVARPRIIVLDRHADDATQDAVLHAVPGRGRSLLILNRKMAGSEEMRRITDLLRARKLLRRWKRDGRYVPSRRGRRLAERLQHAMSEAEQPDALKEHRLAVLGHEAIESEALRYAFTPREPREPERYEFGPSLLDDHPNQGMGYSSYTGMSYF